MKKKIYLKFIDRVLMGGILKQLLALLGVVIFCLLLLTICFIPISVDNLALVDVAIAEDHSWWRILWLKFQTVLFHFLDPGNVAQEGTQLRLFVAIVAILGMALMSGLLVTTFSNIVDRRVSRVEEGKVVYRRMSGHYVIIGFGNVTASIIRKLRDKKAAIVLMTSQDVRMVRSELYSRLSEDYEKRISIYAGDIESIDSLINLNFNTAKEAYILGENTEPGRDSKNLECVRKIAKLRNRDAHPRRTRLMKRVRPCLEKLVIDREGNPRSGWLADKIRRMLDGARKEILPVYVQMDKLTSYSIVQKLSLTEEFRYDNGERTIYFRPFNFYENWARLLWGTVYYKSDSLTDARETELMQSRYYKLDYEPIIGEKYVHLVIVGFASMGQALLLEALRQCHYPNYDEASGKVKTRITVVDWNMDVLLPGFKAQYPYLDQIEDIEIDYRSGVIEDPQMRSMLISEAENQDAVMTIAVCLEDPDLSLTTGLCLPDEVFYTFQEDDDKNKKIVPGKTKVLIRQAISEGGMGRLLDANTAKYNNVMIFGMTDQGVSPELLDDDFAMYINASYAVPMMVDKNNITYKQKTRDGSGDSVSYASLTEAERYIRRVQGISKYKDYIVFDKEKLELAVNDHKPKGFMDIICDSDISEIDRKELREISLKLWLSLSESFKFANRYQVDMYDTYARYCMCDPDNLEALSRMEHLRWNADRSIVGFRAFDVYPLDDDELKDKRDEYKFHPCIRPFSMLQEKEKNKDNDVIGNPQKLKGLAGYKERQYRK